MKLYRTDDMVEALHKLTNKNARVLIHNQLRCLRTIPIQIGDAADLPIRSLIGWKLTSEQARNPWRGDTGLILWNMLPRLVNLPPPVCDAMLVVEAPLTGKQLDALRPSVLQEMVIYRPPSWVLHNETVNRKNPTANTAVLMKIVLAGLAGRGELDEQQVGVLHLSGFAAPTTAVFRADEIRALTGFDEWQLRLVLRNHSKRSAQRWHLYRLRFKPDGDALGWAWDVLSTSPEVEPSVVAVRGGSLRDGRANYLLGQLVREHYVEVLPTIYAVNTERKTADLDMVEAMSNLEYGRRVKIRNMVDEALEY